MRWTAADIPDQSGRIALVTGANSGLGLETARALAARGATVLLACRSLAKAEQAREEEIRVLLGKHDKLKAERAAQAAADGLQGVRRQPHVRARAAAEGLQGVR